jgi:predicted TIM-barrel fold metal-dependent hydrolase
MKGYSLPVLDFHVHVCRREDWNRPVIEFMERVNPSFYRRFPETVDREGLLDFVTGESVDFAVILAEYAPRTTGVVTNKFVAELCAGSERLIPFGCVNLEGDVDPAIDFEAAVSTLGIRGLKVMPSYCWFYPDDPRILPVYEVARGFGVPVMFHTGSSVFPGSRIRFADPLLLDDVAEMFPDLNIIMCHGGRPFWYAQAQWLLRRHRNTYIDVSGVPPEHLPRVFPKLETLRDRFVFGTDWPAIGAVREQVERIRRLPLSVRAVEGILWENAARLLGLEGRFSAVFTGE